MEISGAFFCDAATSDSNNKVNVLGVFRNIISSQFPVIHSQMSLVVMIEGHRSEEGEHHIKINFIDEDGREFLNSFIGNFYINKDAPFANIILNMQNTKFQRPGVYAADIVIDNHHIKTVNINLMQQ